MPREYYFENIHHSRLGLEYVNKRLKCKNTQKINRFVMYFSNFKKSIKHGNLVSLRVD